MKYLSILILFMCLIISCGKSSKEQQTLVDIGPIPVDPVPVDPEPPTTDPEKCPYNDTIFTILNDLVKCSVAYPTPENCDNMYSTYNDIKDLEIFKHIQQESLGRIIDRYYYKEPDCYHYQVIIVDGIVQNVIDMTTSEYL